MKTILLDCFGVCCPEGHFKRNIVQPMCRNTLYSQIEVYYNALKSEKMTEKEFWEKVGWDPEEGRAEMLKRIPIDPKLREVIAHLKRKNYLVVLLSEFPKVWLDAIVKHNNLAALFDKILATPHWGYSKSNQTLYLELKKQLGECVFVDDKIRWLALANKAGIETIWKKTAEEETSYEPDHIIRYLDELKAIL